MSVVILGAVIASREAADKIFPNRTNWIIGFYALVGILITIVGGILASFKYDTRATDLKVLAVASDTLMEEMNNLWNEVIYLKQGDEQISCALEILKAQDTKTGEVLSKGAELTNVMRKLLKQQSSQAAAIAGSQNPSA